MSIVPIGEESHIDVTDLQGDGYRLTCQIWIENYNCSCTIAPEEKIPYTYYRTCRKMDKLLAKLVNLDGGEEVLLTEDAALAVGKYSTI